MKTHHNQNNTNLKPAGFQSAGGSGNRQSRVGVSRIDFARRRSNQLLNPDQLLAALKRETPRLWEISFVVGQWVWLAFSHRPPKRVTSLLSELGFHWSHRRQCWQHPCGYFVDGPSRNDPRDTYGCEYPSRTRNA